MIWSSESYKCQKSLSLTDEWQSKKSLPEEEEELPGTAHADMWRVGPRHAGDG